MSVDSGNDSVSDEFVIVLEGGRPWGFTLQGGADFRSPLKVGRVTRNGRAEKAGLISGDIILNINNVPTSRMKHHEAQRLILATTTTLELNCTKVHQGAILSPKSSTTNKLFDFPSITVPTSTNSANGHARQSSLDLDMFRSRTNSDAGKKQQDAGVVIPKPAPPKFAKTSSADVANIGNPRVIAGITVPPRPPETTPEKEPSVHPSAETEPVVTGFAANGPCVTPPITSETAVVMHSESVEDEEDEKSSSEEVAAAPDAPEGATIEVEPQAIPESQGSKDTSVENSTEVTTTSVVENTTEELEFQQPEIRAYTIQLAEVHHIPKEHLTEQLESETPPNNSTTNSTETATAKVEETLPDTLQNGDSTTSSYDDKGSVNDNDGGILSTSGGSDWYRSMFQSMKKGVEEDLPEKKPVWERTVVPARESKIDFTQSKKSEAPPPAAKPASNRLSWASISSGSYVSSAQTSAAQTKRRSSESSVPSDTIPAMKSHGHTKSSSAIVRPSDCVAADNNEAVVFSRNARKSYSKSRNYWQSLEKQASQEREEIEAKRSSLRRNRTLSLTSSGGSPRSPDNTVSSPTNISPPTITSPTNVTPPPITSPTIVSTANDLLILNEEIAKLGNFSPEPVTAQPEATPTATATVDTVNSTSDEVDGTNDVFVDKNKAPSSVKSQGSSGKNTPLSEGRATPNSGKSTPVMSDIVYSDSPGASRRLHPLLSAELDDNTSKPSETATQQQDVFSRIDANKLSTAIGNASMIGKMEQDGVNPLALQTMAISAGQQTTQPQQKEPAKKKTKPVKPPPGRKAQGKFNFDAASDKELSFKKGDIIDLTKEIDANWLEGTISGNTGIFPVSYVKVLTDEEIEELESASAVDTEVLIAKAKFNFAAKSDRELSFNKDDIITLTRKIDENWYEGHIQDMKGIVPSSYVQLLSEEQ